VQRGLPQGSFALVKEASMAMSYGLVEWHPLEHQLFSLGSGLGSRHFGLFLFSVVFFKRKKSWGRKSLVGSHCAKGFLMLDLFTRS
jgi:hypothetical protein